MTCRHHTCGPLKKKKRRRRMKKIPTIFKCLPLICLLINGPFNSTRYFDIPRQKCCFHYREKEESSVRKRICFLVFQKKKKKKRNVLVSSRVLFFFLIERCDSIESTRCETSFQNSSFLGICWTDVYANHVIFFYE